MTGDEPDAAIDQSDYAQALGARLRAARLARGWSQREVAVKSHGKFPVPVIGSYERGDRQVTVARLYALADWYGVSVHDLLPGPDRDRDRELVRAEARRRALADAALAVAALAAPQPEPEETTT